MHACKLMYMARLDYCCYCMSTTAHLRTGYSIMPLHESACRRPLGYTSPRRRYHITRCESPTCSAVDSSALFLDTADLKGFDVAPTCYPPMPQCTHACHDCHTWEWVVVSQHQQLKGVISMLVGLYKVSQPSCLKHLVQSRALMPSASIGRRHLNRFHSSWHSICMCRSLNSTC